VIQLQIILGITMEFLLALFVHVWAIDAFGSICTDRAVSRCCSEITTYLRLPLHKAHKTITQWRIVSVRPPVSSPELLREFG
jgi:hypothetical protein